MPLVPHLLSSYAALRLPDVHRPRLRFPLPLAYLVAGVFFLAGHLRAPPKRRAVGDSGTAPRRPQLHSETSGPPRLLGRPLHPCRRQTPRPDPPRPTRRIASVSSSAPMKAWTSGDLDLFEADSPGPHVRVPTHRRCCCCQRRKARYRPVGLYFGRVGFAPTGRLAGFQGVIVTSYPTRPALPGRTIGDPFSLVLLRDVARARACRWLDHGVGSSVLRCGRGIRISRGAGRADRGRLASASHTRR